MVSSTLFLSADINIATPVPVVIAVLTSFLPTKVSL